MSSNITPAGNQQMSAILKIRAHDRRFVFMKDGQFLCVARDSQSRTSPGLFWGYDARAAITGKNPRKAADFAIKSSVQGEQDPIGFLSGATLCAYGTNPGPMRKVETSWVESRVQKRQLKMQASQPN